MAPRLAFPDNQALSKPRIPRTDSQSDADDSRPVQLARIDRNGRLMDSFGLEYSWRDWTGLDGADSGLIQSVRD